MAATPLAERDLPVLEALKEEPKSQQTLALTVPDLTRYRLVILADAGFIQRTEAGKNEGTGGRKAIRYKLTRKGKGRVS